MSISRADPEPTGCHQNLLLMAARLANLFDTGDHSDFTIKCESEEYRVHKAIVCPQSEFLKRLCDPKFKEGQIGEAVLEEVDSTLLRQAIRFLYTGSYADTASTNGCTRRAKLAAPSNSTIANEFSLSASALIVVVDDEGVEADALSEDGFELVVSPAGCDNATPDHAQLMLNVRMYILADYLEIAQLKKEALKRCTEVLEHDFLPDSMIGPIRHALEHTSSSDQTLRSVIFRVCSEKRDQTISCTELDELLSKEEPIAWNLLKEQQLKHSQRLQSSELVVSKYATEILALELQLRDLRHELGGAEAAIQHKEDQLEDCVRLSQKWSGCRNCNIEFDVELERHRHTGEYFIRCKKCRCRHEEY